MARNSRQSADEDDDSSTESLTIFLAKEGLSKVAEIIKSPSTLKSYPITDADGDLGTLYIQNRSASPPRWAKFFEDQVDRAAFGRTSSAAAVLFVPIDDRVMLLAFGQGRHLIDSDCVEDRFGRRVTLNSVGENKVRSLDKQTFDTTARHTRVQSSKETRPSDLGIDVDQDLLRAITGSPTDDTLGKTLSGVDSLHAMVRVDLEGLRELLSDYLAQFRKDSYKESFAWVDQIAEVTDKTKQSQLDELMLEKVHAGEFDRCWLAVPEPIDWSLVAGFRYRRGTRQPVLNDIGFDSFLESFPDNETATLTSLHRRDATCIGADELPLYSWPIYRCIYCEIDLDGSTYLLSGGRWYCVDMDFVKLVDEEIRRIPKSSRALPEYSDDTEGDYNTRVALSDKDVFALMDRKLISIGGGHSRIEFCDLYTDSKELIHVKRYGGSGALSHLFAQAAVSGQLFASDQDFRKAANSLLPRSHKLSDSAQRPDAGQFTIVFAVISHEAGASLTLPFFSRLTLKNSAKLLRGYGYRVALAKVNVSSTVAKLKRYKAAK